MKKIIFNGHLTSEEGIVDVPTFVELSICSYGYKKDGEKLSLAYVAGIADDDMTIIRRAVEIVNFVKAYGFNKADIYKLIKGIKRNGADLVMLFGEKELSNLIKDLKEIAEDEKQLIDKLIKTKPDCDEMGIYRTIDVNPKEKQWIEDNPSKFEEIADRFNYSFLIGYDTSNDGEVQIIYQYNSPTVKNQYLKVE